MKTLVYVTILLLTAVRPAVAADLIPLRSLDQMFTVLESARTVLLDGLLADEPNSDPAKRKVIMALPYTISEKDDILRLAQFFKEAQFKKNATLTKLFKEGMRVNTMLGVHLVVDNKYEFWIDGIDLLSFADNLTYRTRRYRENPDTNFSKELAYLLRQIQESRAQKVGDA